MSQHYLKLNQLAYTCFKCSNVHVTNVDSMRQGEQEKNLMLGMKIRLAHLASCNNPKWIWINIFVSTTCKSLFVFLNIFCTKNYQIGKHERNIISERSNLVVYLNDCQVLFLQFQCNVRHISLHK